MGNVSDSYLAVFITAIVVFIVLFICGLIHFCMSKMKSMLYHVLALVDFIAHAVLILFYMILTKLMSKVDLQMYHYLNDNQCADGALARGVFKVVESYSKDSKLIYAGFGLVIAGCAANILIYLFTYKSTMRILCCSKDRDFIKK